ARVPHDADNSRRRLTAGYVFVHPESSPHVGTGALRPARQILAGRPGCAPDLRTPHAADPCRQRGHATVQDMEDPTPLIRAQVGALHRSGRLTPYLAEFIIDDVRRRGAGARVEIRF